MKTLQVTLVMAFSIVSTALAQEEGAVTLTVPLPTVWNAETGKNVLWRTAVPGLGHSGPAVWDNLVFITTAIPKGGDSSYPVGLSEDLSSADDDQAYTWQVQALDIESGVEAWKTVLHAGQPRNQRHRKNSYATPTPATDGRSLVVSFGSEGLYCLDLDGKLRWKVDLGALAVGFFADPSLQWGYASSPVLFGESVIVQVDTDQDGFLAAFSLATGEQLWKAARSDGQSWSTPAIARGEYGAELIVSAARAVRGYEATSGKELWSFPWAQDIVISSPIVAPSGLVIANSGKGKAWQPILAIHPGGRGDISLPEGSSSSERIAWSRRRGGTIVTTPAVDREHLFTLVDIGVLRAFAVETGALLYQERLEDSFLASPMIVDEKLFLTAESGTVYVVGVGVEYELLAKNELGEPCVATPRPARDVLIFRCLRHVFGIRAEPSAGPDTASSQVEGMR